MTKQDFLDRMSNAYDMGLCAPEVLRLADIWTDAVMRFEGGQIADWYLFLEQEYKRLGQFVSSKTLANDADGYKLINLVAIMTHPCQVCATDPEAWHTRSGFCPHRDSKGKLKST